MLRQHKNRILRLATSLSSRQAAFLFALTGVVVQAFHTYYITNELSSLSGFWRVLQALLMAGFISCALLYFTLKSSDEDTKAAKRYRRTVWWFAIIETFINLYYWGNHLLIQKWPDPDYGSFLIALPFSFLIPFTLKVYAGEVRTDDYSDVEISPDGFENFLHDTFHTEKNDNTIDTAYTDDPQDPPIPTEPIEHPTTASKADFEKLHDLMHSMDDEEQNTETEQVPQPEEPVSVDEPQEPPVDTEVETEQVPQPEEHQPEEPVYVDEPHDPPVETETVEVAQPEEPIKTFPIVEDSQEPQKEDNLPELGKEILNTFANGGLSSTPAYVAPKSTNPEDELFNYKK